MLALTRFVGESIVIGPPEKPIATIRIVDIRHNGAKVPGKVRLSFDADKSVLINREEVATAILKAKAGEVAGG